MYPAELTAPMAKDLTNHGFEALTTPEEVSSVLDKKEGTVMVVVNSVCGCAAANARPGAKLAAQNDKTPDTTCCHILLLHRQLLCSRTENWFTFWNVTTLRDARLK